VTESFDICGPLPSGVTVLEASAGTGKTYTIAALAARYVAEGTPLDQLLLVTFTRMATGELRDRVRERLMSAERALAGAGEADELVRLLAGGSPEEVALRRARLGRALADFDAATIATTHGFCQEVLGGLGVAGDVERDAAFVEDVTDLVDEVVDDLYVRRFFLGERPPLTRAEAGRVAAIAVANPVAPIEPADAPETTLRAMRARLAVAVRGELELRKQRLGVITYDDLLTRLDAALGGDGGEAIAARLRERWRVVLVDEFQDTDPVQWSIVRRAFGTGTLVLIGDPKQAIYAFRGADVYAYLDAARSAATRATLDVNWRSDQGLIDAYDALFAGARLGHEGIVYRQVRATDANRSRRLDGAGAPLRIRAVERASVETTRYGYARLGSAREHVAADLAGDLVGLLSSTATVERRAADGTTLEREPIRPRHVAVLVQTNRTAAHIRDALDAVGIPAVINGAGSVFGTPSAGDWLRLLEALERPTSSPRARAAALTPFLGWTAEQVAGAGEAEWEAVHRRLHDWSRVLRVRGVASLMEVVTLAESLPERVLAAVEGERELTDLRHVGELLHAAATTEQLGTTALVAWLRRRIAEARQDTHDEDRSRRLESDAEAVQVLTVHRSKGLEFPVVYYPDLWEPGYIREGEPVAYHDPDAGDRRTIDVGLDGADFNSHRRQHLIEQRGEDLRIAYVALTRAQHQAVVWWAPSWNSRHSSLGRLLFARTEDGSVPADGRVTPDDTVAWDRFSTLAGEAQGCVSVERSQLGLPMSWSGLLRGPAELTAARFDRELDRRWRRTSFSDITAGAGEARVASEPEEPVVADEPEGPVRVVAPDGDDALRATPSLLAGMPAGVEIGTFVHRVLEATDFAAEDLSAELALRVDESVSRRPLDVGDPAVVATGLRAAIETPLGPLLDGARLRDLGRTDRLDELAFEFPLVGGDTPRGGLALEGIATALREHLPPGDPLTGYAERLTDPALRHTVRGYLTGTIDLVARVDDRFTVIDYKTNWLGTPGDPLTAWHHRPSALAAEMERAHYGLQALLYTVALHRYLRWRLPNYNPNHHLAGVGYLFLRGMTGPDTPTVEGTPCGVFAWQPSGALVQALSDVLDRGVPAEPFEVRA
jgi:exodeoxyribonuclease V beta subunit